MYKNKVVEVNNFVSLDTGYEREEDEKNHNVTDNRMFQNIALIYLG